MKKRLSIYQGEYPIWVWAKKPDLSRSGHLEPGTEGVCLELDLPDNNVLLSDFDAWHCVLNNWPLEYDEGELGKNLDQERIKESWERIFDYETLWKSPYWGGQNNRLQGVTGKVSISCVKEVTVFTAVQHYDD